MTPARAVALATLAEPPTGPLTRTMAPAPEDIALPAAPVPDDMPLLRVLLNVILVALGCAILTVIACGIGLVVLSLVLWAALAIAGIIPVPVTLTAVVAFGAVPWLLARGDES